MNARELVDFESRHSVGVWYCGKCGTVWGNRQTNGHGREMAERCCTPRKCDECGQDVVGDGHYHTRHRECQGVREARQNSERVEKAEKLDDWDGWVYADGVGYRDGYFRSLEDLVDHLVGDGVSADDWPEWCFVCKEVPFPEVDPAVVYERVTEESFDGAYDALQGTTEFEAACQAFREANAHLVSWEPDYSKAVRVPRPDREGEK